MLNELKSLTLNGEKYDSFVDQEARKNAGKSVTEYGAKGDGVTDDTAAFNAALKDAAGKCLHVPAGKYLITSTLYIHDNTTLYGDGMGSQILTKVADGFVFNGVNANGVVSTMVKTVIIRGVCFDNKLPQDSVTKLQPGNFIDKFRGSTMRDCRVLHYYNVFTTVEIISTLAHNRFSYVYHCFCRSTTDAVIDGNYINASVYGNPHGSRCFEYSVNSLSFTNNFVDYFRHFSTVKSTTGSSFVGNKFSRMVTVFHDIISGFTISNNMFSHISYIASDWKALKEEQREQLANEIWSVIKIDNEFIKTAMHMRNVTFTSNISIKPVDNYIYISDTASVYPAYCEFRDNVFTTDGVTPSGVKAHFINFPILDKYNIMKNVYFDFWDMKTYTELPNPTTKGKRGQPIFSFPYMRAVYNGNIYINIHDSWQKETHIGGRLTATGEVLGLTDTMVDKLQGLVVYGKSTQSGTPTLETPVPIVSSGDDGAVDVVITEKNMFGGQAWRDVCVRDMKGTYDEDAGTVTTGAGYMGDIPLFGNFAPKTQYTIVITGYNTRDTAQTANLRVHYKGGGIDNLRFPNYGPTKGVIVHTTRVNATIDEIRGQYAAGSTVFFVDECGIFKGEITAEDFKAYTAQTLSVPTPNGLCGIPVTSGGNYTDADGQQWICDEIDLSSGVMVQKVGKIESYAGETINGAWLSSTGELSEGATVLYDLYALPEVEEGEEVEEVEEIEIPLPEDVVAEYEELHTYRRDTNIYSYDKAGITVDYLVAGHDGVDWSSEDISLGVNTDGLLHLFIDGKPVGNGVECEGGSVEGAVLYTEQTLTEEQKAQARKNIGAGSVVTVNGKTPDKNGNVTIETGGGTPTYTFRNLLNPNDENYEAGKYVNPNTGETANNASYNTSGYIEVSPGDKICTTISHTEESSVLQTFRQIMPIVWIAYYDENKNVIKGDGRISGEKIYHLIPRNVRYVRLSIAVSYAPRNPMIEKLTCVGISDEYLEYGQEKTVPAPSGYNPDGMFLPPYIYAVKGRPFDIYTAAMFGDTQNLNRIERIGTTYSGFGEFEMSNRRIRLNPTGGGGDNLYFKIKNAEGVTVLSDATKCVVNNGSTAAKNIVTIGDSLTDRKPWIAELMRLNPNYNFVGGIDGIAKDSEGTTRTFKHEGRSGWRAEQYYTGYGGAGNYFWDGSQFSFSHYVTERLGGTAPDVVILFLGMNDMERNLDDAVNYEKLMVDNIRSSYPNLPIIICAPQARDYNVEGHVAKNGFLMMKKLYEKFCLYTNLYFVPLYLIHDSEYNYCLADEHEGVNLYSTIVKNKVVDSVHPQDAGYFQFADAIYGALSAIG